MADDGSTAGTQRDTVTYEGLDRTEDTNDPVLRVRVAGTQSYMDVILARDEKRIHVWSVESERSGDMKRMLDKTVRKLGWRDVTFLSPLDDLKARHQTRLDERLQGFETHTETIRTPDGTTEKQKRYSGVWNV